MDTQNWPKNEWEDIYYSLQEISRKMENIMINCVDDIDAKRFAQDCYDDIETWIDTCKQKGNFTVETLDLTSSKKPIKSDYKGLDDEVGDLQIDMTNTGYFEDGWLRIEGENEEGYRDGTEFTINAYGPNGEDLGSKKFDFLDLWHKGPIASSKEPIESAMPGREKGIRAIMDEYGCSWEEAEEIMNEGIESACHDKSKKKAKKTEKIEQTRRARNTESLNNLYGKMFS